MAAEHEQIGRTHEHLYPLVRHPAEQMHAAAKRGIARDPSLDGRQERRRSEAAPKRELW